MNNANEKALIGASPLTDVLDINGRVMWFTPDGIGHSCDWRQLTFDARRMIVDWGGGIKTVEFADACEITVWLPRELSNTDTTAPHPDVTSK